MKASLFLFATDLHDEGLATVLDNVEHRAGAQGLTLACAYHHARDIFPHNPVRKVRFLEGGTIFFQPDPRRYAGLRIAPQISRLAGEWDALAALLPEAERRGLAVRAWTVYLHNTTLGSRYPDCAVQNVFGDPYITHLCPANPDVRAYVRALSGDLAARGVESILAESLSYQPFDHGYHHERSFVPLSPVARYLLGLCFCDHCLAWARADGVAVEEVRRFVRAAIEDIFAGEPETLPAGEPRIEEVGALVGGELGGYLRTRQRTVTSLVTEASEAASAAGCRGFTMLEMSGASKGYATGEPTGAAAAASAWQDGVEVTALGEASHRVGVVGYARDPARLRLDLTTYRALLPAGTPLALALRPMAPDCDSVENLAAKLAIAREEEVAWVDFYHYGLMRLSQLDLIREALRA